MDDYAAWRSQVLRNTTRLPLSHASKKEPVDNGRAQPRSSLPQEEPLAFSSAPLPAPRSPSPLDGSSTPVKAAASTGERRPPFGNPNEDTTATTLASTAARLAEVLHDIAATERGQEKTWCNVQPCVLHTVKLLASALQAQSSHLQQLEDTWEQTQECLGVLVRDRAVKEERYRLDAAAHQAEMEQLWERVRLLETQRQQEQQVQQQCGHYATEAVPATALESQMNALQRQLHSLQRQLRAATKSELQHKRDHLRQQSPSSPSRSSSSSSHSSCASSSTPNAIRRDDRLASPSSWNHVVDKTRVKSHSPVTQHMLEEVHRLRRQWRHFLKTVPPAWVQGQAEDRTGGEQDAARANVGESKQRSCFAEEPLHRRGKGQDTSASRSYNFSSSPAAKKYQSPLDRTEQRPSSESLDDTEVYADDVDREVYSNWHCNAYSDPTPRHPERLSHASGSAWTGLPSSPSPLPSSGRRVRWYWTDDAATSPAAFTNAYPSSVQRTRHGGAEWAGAAIPWSEWHAFDGRTDCWYSLGSWASHRDEVATLRQSGAPHARGQKVLHRSSSSSTPTYENGDESGEEVRCSVRTGHYGWMSRAVELVAWVHPAHLCVRRAGIYTVKVCMVRHCRHYRRSNSCSSAERATNGVGGRRGSSEDENYLSLWVEGVRVAGLRERVSHTASYAQPRSPTTLPPPAGAPSSSSRGTGPGRQAHRAGCAPSPYADSNCDVSSREAARLPQHTRLEAAHRALRRRPCCEPAHIYTHTLVATLYLPAGVSLLVRCSEQYGSGRTIQEAFCELTYLV